MGSMPAGLRGFHEKLRIRIHIMRIGIPGSGLHIPTFDARAFTHGKGKALFEGLVSSLGNRLHQINAATWQIHLAAC